MSYNPINDLLYLKERLDEQGAKIDKLEKAVVKILEILDVMIGSENECNAEVKK